MEEAEVAAFVGLRDFVEEEREVAALDLPRRGLPCGLAGGEFVVGDFERERARRDIERDQVAVADERERAADRALPGATWRTQAP